MKRSRFGAVLAAIASLGGLFTPTPRETQPVEVVARTRVQQRETTPQAPATNMTVAANRSLGIIDAPDFRSYRRAVPIWTGRPRSRHGRMYGPYGRV